MRKTRVAAVSVCLTVSTLAAIAPAAHASAFTTAWSKKWLNVWDRSSSPVVADVNGDGINDIVIGAQDGYLRVLNGATGANISGWPQKAIVSGGAAAIDSTPAVGDLDGDGKPEIAVGIGSTWVGQQNGGVVVFNSNGTTRCRFMTHDMLNVHTGAGVPDGYSDGVYSSPAIGDVNGDHKGDIVFGSFDHRIYAIDRFCHKELEYDVEDTIWSSPALYDINGDGKQEILIGADQSPGGRIDWTGGEFRVLKWTSAGAVEVWKRQVNDVIWSSPAIGDIDGDGRVEVVVGAGDYFHGTDGHKIFAWHADDGSPLKGWPYTTGASTASAPALGDVTGDGVPEVIDGSRDGYVRAIRGNGSLLWAKHLTFNNTRYGAGVNPPIVADVNGDGHNDVLAGNDWAMFVLNGSNGAELAQLNTSLAHGASAAVGDFGPAGWKIIVAGFDTPNHFTTVQGFDIVAPGNTAPWPMWRRERTHKAGPVGGANLLPPGYCRQPTNPAAAPNVASSNGYWVNGRDGAIYSLKGAPNEGSSAGAIHGYALGMGVTPSGLGYFQMDSTGHMYAYGDARTHGSMAGKVLSYPLVGMTVTPTGHGYWQIASNGSVFPFGDAKNFGSTAHMTLSAPIVAIAPTHTGLGYYLLAQNGSVFPFGDAVSHGSAAGLHLTTHFRSMTVAPDDSGYWLMPNTGRVFAYGVGDYGSIPGTGKCFYPASAQVRVTLTGLGYFVIAADGSVWPFGDAVAGVNAPKLGLANSAVDLGVRP
ncbi:MAG TPA: VCBS repeat-containing protein [Acidimicrobiia bacterium]|nr:VCBS repeat-containing protein [Acidimicrobiia bacterium]